jgi:hypothetical protein
VHKTWQCSCYATSIDNNDIKEKRQKTTITRSSKGIAYVPHAYKSIFIETGRKSNYVIIKISIIHRLCTRNVGSGKPSI